MRSRARSAASIRAEGPGSSRWLSSPVDFEVRFRLEGLAPGAYDVVGSVSGSAKQARARATVDGGGEARADLSFGGGLRLTGRVLQGEQPVSGATLSLEGIDIDIDGWTETDQAGSFAIEGLVAGNYRIQVQQGRTGLSHQDVLELTTSREVVLRVPTARVLGIVSDASDDGPIAGVRVWLDSAAAATDAVPDFFPRHAATTDQEGRFAIDNVAEGSWIVVGEKQGYARRSLPVQVGRNRDVEDLRLRLDPTEGLSLEIFRANGAIPDEVRIAVLDSTGFAVSSGSYSTGEGGRVRLRSVPAGQWQVLVGAEGSATTSITAIAPGTANRVELPPPCSLRVSVPELVGSALLSAVTLSNAAGQPFRAVGFLGQPTSEWRMSGGDRSFDALPPGQWTVRVLAPDGRSWQGTATTTPGPPITVRLGEN